MAVAMFDLDDFKKANDTFGHAKGDEVILRLANLMKELSERNFYGTLWRGELSKVLSFFVLLSVSPLPWLIKHKRGKDSFNLGNTLCFLHQLKEELIFVPLFNL